MKKIFALSITLNVALLVATGMLGISRFYADQSQVHSQPAESAGILRAQPSSSSPASSAAASFHWSQLESDDYPTYISRLRAIGCPEATIRRLVTSEVKDTYVEKRRELETKASAHITPQAIAAEIQEMENEEANLLRTVLQPNSSSSSQHIADNVTLAGLDSTPTYWDLTARVPQVRIVSMPLAFQIADAVATPGITSQPPLDQSTPPLTDSQREAVELSRKEFIDAIGGDKQDPNDPEYLRRWQKAQWVAEEQLRAQLGDELYNKMQIQAAQREYHASRGR
ncbi:hypothetical protein ACXR0O_13120 [Verrucomicrobiota bacterium sgz303538]